MLHLEWSRCLNVRDVGGYRTLDGAIVRTGALIRSDSLCNLDAGGQMALVAYGVRTVMDLRAPFELELAPHPFADNHALIDRRELRAGVASGADSAERSPAELVDRTVRYVHLPLIEDGDVNGTSDFGKARTTLAFYNLILRRYPNRLAMAVATFATAPAGGVLVHCFAGKDRTGLVVALLLAVAGVSDQTIAEDYARSDDHLQPLYAELLATAPADEEARRNLAAQLSCPPSIMLAVLSALRADFGSVEQYLLGGGASDLELARARDRLRR